MTGGTPEPTPDVVGAIAEMMAAPFYGRPRLREFAPCAECGEPHAIETECYANGAFATAPDRMAA